MSDEEELGFQKRAPAQPVDGSRLADSRLPVQPPLDFNPSSVNGNNPQPGLPLPPSHRSDTRTNEPEKPEQKEAGEEAEPEVRPADAARSRDSAGLHAAGLHNYF